MDQQIARELSTKMMRKQLRLSVAVAACFGLVIIGLPLLNWLAPGLAATRIAGFSATWLILGLLFYPLTWALSTWFVKSSETIEQQIVAEHSGN